MIRRDTTAQGLHYALAPGRALRSADQRAPTFIYGLLFVAIALSVLGIIILV
jgi:hypothetical protein